MEKKIQIFFNQMIEMGEKTNDILTITALVLSIPIILVVMIAGRHTFREYQTRPMNRYPLILSIVNISIAMVLCAISVFPETMGFSPYGMYRIVLLVMAVFLVFPALLPTCE